MAIASSYYLVLHVFPPFFYLHVYRLQIQKSGNKSKGSKGDNVKAERTLCPPEYKLIPLKPAFTINKYIHNLKTPLLDHGS